MKPFCKISEFSLFLMYCRNYKRVLYNFLSLLYGHAFNNFETNWKIFIKLGINVPVGAFIPLNYLPLIVKAWRPCELWGSTRRYTKILKYSVLTFCVIIKKIKLSLSSINYALYHEDMGEWSIAPQFITSTLNELNGQLQAPAALPQGKSPRFPFNLRLGGPQGLFGSCGEETNSASLGFEPWSCSS